MASAIESKARARPMLTDGRRAVICTGTLARDSVDADADASYEDGGMTKVAFSRGHVQRIVYNIRTLNVQRITGLQADQ